MEHPNLKLVLPGDAINTSDEDFTYTINSSTYSSILGFLNKSSGILIPINNYYFPSEGELIIGNITYKTPDYLIISFNDYTGIIPSKESPREQIRIKSLVRGKIYKVGDNIEISLNADGCGILNGGYLINFGAGKLRLLLEIRKDFIERIKEIFGLEATYGMNGYIWLRGDLLNIAKAFKLLNELDNYYYSPFMINKVIENLYVQSERQTAK
ncbi:MAG: hypothetical protein QXV66_01130 [Candidatus Rehaiarchaeum fermentans]|nr:hypothetical protein [Candidatus Rehaiarchaeum fermentans]